MPTNLDLDDKLILIAQKLGKHGSKKAAVTEALKTYIQIKKQRELSKSFGTIEFDDDYDYKEQRGRT